MARAVLITLRFHDGRYHGTGDGPPSPARLFQALVAGAGLGGPLSLSECKALKWLEEREAPAIASPPVMKGQEFDTYVPNNDLDAVGGDARRIGSIRAAKTIRPTMFNVGVSWLYAWAFEEDEESGRQAHAICALAERLYQLGRGVDMAWAWGEVLDAEDLEARLSSYPGLVFRPSDGGRGRTLACPQPGSLASLEARYAAGSQRFTTEGNGKATKHAFSQPPKPRFAQITYESPPSMYVYDLRDGTREAAFGAWPLARVSKLVVLLRNAAVIRLSKGLPTRSPEIERVLVGRKADGADDGPAALRVRIVPLPSIGHHHADRAIRRVMVDVPAGCTVRADDVDWAFSGLDVIDTETGEVFDLVLTRSDDDSMLAHYGTANGERFRVWRTATPAALPDSAKRRRIDPKHVEAQAKDGAERALEQSRAAAAVTQALRHAEVRTRVESIRVQREPFEARGERVEAFASGTRFAKERLWHVEIAFNAPIAGPLVIGDGRFLGLGVMAPIQWSQGVYAFLVEDGLEARPDPAEVARALRRAVMARVQDVLGRRTSLSSFFTGHDRDGSPARNEHSHLTFAFDPGTARLLIVAPHVIDRRSPTREEVTNLASLESALADLWELRAGSSGRLALRAGFVDPDADPLFAASRTWETITPYQVTRHEKRSSADEALIADLMNECRRRGLPEPRVTTRDLRGLRGFGLVGGARLVFKVAVQGPIVLGKSRHLGGGLFSSAVG